jgi:hypothetical protein
VTFASSAKSQINPSNIPFQTIVGCVNSAVQSSNIHKRGNNILFLCRGNLAKQFYDTLGSYGYDDIDGTGPGSSKFRIKEFTQGNKPNSCHYQYTLPDGRSTSQFECRIYLHAGDFINK